MSALISKSLRSEVLSSAKKKQAGAIETLYDMYREHAKEAAKRANTPWTKEHDDRIRQKVQQQLHMS